jgi:hypothetical protein
MPRPFYPRGKICCSPVDRTLDEPQNQSGHCEHLPILGIQLWFLSAFRPVFLVKRSEEYVHGKYFTISFLSLLMDQMSWMYRSINDKIYGSYAILNLTTEFCPLIADGHSSRYSLATPEFREQNHFNEVSLPIHTIHCYYIVLFSSHVCTTYYAVASNNFVNERGLQTSISFYFNCFLNS